MEPHSSSPLSLTLSESEEPGPRRSEASELHPFSYSSTQKPELKPKERASISFLKALGGLFKSIHPQQAEGRKDLASLREAVELLFEQYATGEGDVRFVPEEQNLIRNIFDFSDMSVSDIMIPRADIFAVPHTITFEELKHRISEEQHSRIPVYKENLDAVVGFLHVKDVAVNAFTGKPFHMESVLRKVLFVPPSMKVLDLLVKMRGEGVHIAIVVDEYGGTDGLVTMEDIMEEIVGEIHDEHDTGEQESRSFAWLDEGVIEADARMEIDELLECFGENAVLEEDKEDCDTIGGLIFSHLGHIPDKGEEFEYPTGLYITVLDADARMVKHVRIKRLAKEASDVPQIFGK